MMIQQNKSEKGQAIILIVLTIMVVMGLVGLAIDGGQTYSDRRRVQNAADAAALAEALKYQKNVEANLADPYTDLDTSAQTVAATNGYASTNSVVLIDAPVDTPTGACPGNVTGKDFTVTITSTVRTSFAPVVGVSEVHNTTTSTSRSCPVTYASPFPGAAVVGLDPSGTSYSSGNSAAAKWYLTGGGIFANNDAYSKNSTSVTFLTPDTCITAVGSQSNFACTPIHENQTSSKINYPADIPALLPPIPACSGTAYTGADGKIHEQSGHENKGSVVDGIEHDYAPGVYCVTGLSGMTTLHGATTGTGVTLFIQSTNFTIKFNGGGYIGITAPTNGPYAGVMMFSDLTTTPCTQNMEFRGNGSAINGGTIFLPSACIDFRGNSDGNLQQTQLIGYRVTSNGNASVAINYNPNKNYKRLVPPTLELLR